MHALKHYRNSKGKQGEPFTFPLEKCDFFTPRGPVRSSKSQFDEGKTRETLYFSFRKKSDFSHFSLPGDRSAAPKFKGKIVKSRIFLPPTLQKERAPAEYRKIKENREKPEFFIPTLRKSEGVHERAPPREPRQGRSGGASEWTPPWKENIRAGRRPAGLYASFGNSRFSPTTANVIGG